MVLSENGTYDKSWIIVFMDVPYYPAAAAAVESLYLIVNGGAASKLPQLSLAPQVGWISARGSAFH